MMLCNRGLLYPVTCLTALLISQVFVLSGYSTRTVGAISDIICSKTGCSKTLLGVFLVLFCFRKVNCAAVPDNVPCFGNLTFPRYASPRRWTNLAVLRTVLLEITKKKDGSLLNVAYHTLIKDSYESAWVNRRQLVRCQMSTTNGKVLGFKNNPKVRAECSSTNMFIYVDTTEPFGGIINARNHRDSCFQLGDGVSRQTILIVPLLNTPADPIYCAQQRDLTSGDYKVYIDVHAHKILELENDKTFLISCSETGMLGNGSVRLSVTQNGGETSRLTAGDQYQIQVAFSEASSLVRRNQQLDVRNCIAFGRGNASQQLSDNRGCPVEGSSLSKFESNTTTATATLTKMLKFQDSTQVHLQCDVGFCRAPCPPLTCPGDADYNPNDVAIVQKLPRSDSNIKGIAGSTFLVTEPGGLATGVNSPACGYGEWVLALCITFGILFLIMLIVNIIMCSAISCNCTRKDQVDEVQHDQWGEYHGEYDTVKNVWSNSMSGGSIPGDMHSTSHPGPGPGSQYQPRGPSPYYTSHPRPTADSEDIRPARPNGYAPHNASATYADNYAMVHRTNGAPSTKY